MQVPSSDISAIVLTTTLLVVVIVLFFIVMVVTYQKKIRKKQEEFFKAILETQEKERIRIGRDLHDEAGPLLSGIKHEIQSLDLDGKIKLLSSMDQVITTIRTATHNLSSPGLETKGLPYALDYLCSRLAENTAIDIHLDIDLKELMLSKFASTQLYRIISELINNALKHSKCDKLFVQLLYEEDVVQIIVIDNGCGMDPVSPAIISGLGWQSIKQRMKLLNGKHTIESKPYDATIITITFPVNNVRA